MRSNSMLRLWSCLGLLWVFGVGGTARAEERFALLVGANTGWAQDRPLRYAEEDAAHLREVLVDLGGFAADRVQLLEQPDTATLRASLRNLSGRLRGLGEPSLVFLYFAGHMDERGLHLGGATLSRWELQEAFDALPATVRLGVLHLCLPQAAGVRSPTVELEQEWETRKRGLVVIQERGEACGGADSPEGTTFTHRLLSGLRGAADGEGDGRVRLSEALGPALKRTWPEAPVAEPSASAAHEPFLTEPGKGRAWLEVPVGSGPHLVMDGDAVLRVAEVHAGPAVLALAPGTYQVLRWRGLQLERAALALAPGARVGAATLTYEATPATCLPRCGAEGLEGEALLTWRGREAWRLLAARESGAALSLFDTLLARRPKDGGARRGKARALVQQAEARSDKPREEYELLRQALEVEPSLAKDPDFQARLQRVEGSVERTSRIRALQQEKVGVCSVPWGLSLEVSGSRGFMAPVLTVAPWKHLHLYGAVDLLGGEAVDVGARLVAGFRHVGFFAGVGAHLAVNAEPELAQRIGYKVDRQLYGDNLHVDVGLRLSWENFVVEPGVAGQWDGTRRFVRAPTVSVGYFCQGAPPS